MTDFERYIGQRQVTWRRKYLSTQEWGKQNRVEAAWILPKELWEEGLWPGIRSDSDHSLPDYLKENDIEKHDGVHNLKSSWVLCANLYFPFRRDPGTLGGFLKQRLHLPVESVDRVELEYAEKPPLDPHTLLGEPAKGKRGKNQTSPDLGFIVNNGKGLVLVENKFTEHFFYECSGRKYNNPDPDRCLDFEKLYNNLKDNCNQLQWTNEARPNRKYWDYLRISEKGKEALKRCPAAISGCQLFRQQALAEGIAESGKYEFVVSCVAYDSRNEALIECMSSAGIDDFTKDWAGLFDGDAQFATFTHQQWVNWVRNNDNRGRWKEWLRYIEQRYGY